jgi:hypothetical protein
MSQIIKAHFDGKVIVPDEPIELPVGKSLNVHVELIDAESAPFADLLDFGVDAPDVPPDLGAQHDHYLYGTPKR